MPKIAIIGASGTGKTDLLNAVREKKPRGNYINNSVEKVIAKLGTPAVMDSNKLMLFQKAVFFEQIENEAKYPHFISDGSVLDILAYCKVWQKEGKLDDISELEDYVMKYLAKEPYDLFVHLPTELKKLKNKKEQKKVDREILVLSAKHRCDTDCDKITLKGDTPTRLEILSKFLRWNLKS